MIDNQDSQARIWQQGTRHPSLDRDLVHLWRANLDLPTTIVTELTTYLSADEITKANRFRFPQHRSRFIVARGVLRQLLGNYLHINPREIKFEYGDRGKPYLSSVGDRSLQFNISHSQKYALYGFTYDYAIGVDLEYLREMSDAVKIAQRFFSPQEFQLVNCLTGKQQQRVFFKLWTAKEAFLKATGTGLAGSLNSVDIGLSSTESPCLQAIAGNSQAARSWSMYPCIPAQDYVGAIALKAQISSQQISYWHWHQDLLIV